MDKDREDDDNDDAIRERLLNRNRRKRNRDEEGGDSSRKQKSDKWPEEQNSSSFQETLHVSRQAALMSPSQPSNSLALNPALVGSRGLSDLTTVGMHPNVAASSPFSVEQTMLYGQSSQLPGINSGYSETAGLSPFLLQQQQRQQLLQQQQQQQRLMQHAQQQQQQQQQQLASSGFTNDGNPCAGGLHTNDPKGLLRGASTGSLLPPFAKSSMDSSLYRPYPSELQRQMLPNSMMQSQSGRGFASSTMQSLGGLGFAYYPVVSEQDWSTSPRLPQQPPPPESPPPSPLPPPPPLDEIDLSRTADLYMPTDDDVLSDNQCFARKQTEFFVAQQIDIDHFTPGRRKELSVGQVGIRCKHCANLPPFGRSRGAVYFPSTLRALYQAGQNMASVHLTNACEKIDPELKARLIEMQEKKSGMGHGGKKYWAEGAMARGIYETERGLRFREKDTTSKTT
jgi:type II secretory pathway pseudopilin PulG